MTSHIRFYRSVSLLATTLLAFASLLPAAEPAETAGSTRVATWKDDKKAVFMLMFDDSCGSQEQNVVPALQKHNMSGTFYAVPAGGQWKAKQAFWESKAPAIPGIVYGNHTMNHRGFPTVEDAEKELSGCNEVIMKLFPGKQPRLISFAEPGGVKDAISREEVDALLIKNNLIRRPTFNGHGAFIHFKTAEDVLKLVDKAISTGAAEYIIFHGVGGDWIAFDLQQFNSLLDGLETRRADLWITDHISAHQYQTEKEGAKVELIESTENKIVVDLKSSADAAFYDLPLTLVTRVPATWTAAVVRQKDGESKVAVSNGEVRYDASPGAGPVTLQASN